MSVVPFPRVESSAQNHPMNEQERLVAAVDQLKSQIVNGQIAFLAITTVTKHGSVRQITLP